MDSSNLEILANDSTLIPVGDIRTGISPLCVGVRELTVPGSGSIDILNCRSDSLSQHVRSC